MAWQYIADLIETALKSCEFTENRRFIVAELADIYRLVQSKDVEERKRISKYLYMIMYIERKERGSVNYTYIITKIRPCYN